MSKISTAFELTGAAACASVAVVTEEFARRSLIAIAENGHTFANGDGAAYALPATAAVMSLIYAGGAAKLAWPSVKKAGDALKSIYANRFASPSTPEM